MSNLSRWKQSFRGPLSSALLNNAFEEIHRELGSAALHLQKVTESKDLLTSALSYQLQAVSSLYNNVANSVSSMNTIRGILYRSMYDTSGLTYKAGTRMAATSSLYGVAYLPPGRKMSFIPQTIDEYSREVVDPSVEVHIDDILQPSSSKVYGMLNRYEASLWFETGIGPELANVKILLPKSPASKLNYIEIQPMPNFTQSITDFSIKDYTNTFDSPYDEFPTITSNGFFSFEDTSFNDGVSFDLTPWNVSGGVRGIKFFDCGYIDFIGSANLRFTMTSTTTIQQITHIAHTPTNLEFSYPGTNYLGFVETPAVTIRVKTGSYNGTVLWNNIDYAYPQDSGVPIPMGSGVHTLYIDIDFNKVNDSTPLFKDITIYFT